MFRRSCANIVNRFTIYKPRAGWRFASVLLASLRTSNRDRLVGSGYGLREILGEEFREIAERFPGAEMGKLAARVLAKRGKAPISETAEPAATLSGELAFFGLPTVLQSLGTRSTTR